MVSRESTAKSVPPSGKPRLQQPLLTKMVSREDVAAVLSRYGNDWSAKVAESLRIPEMLFDHSAEKTRTYSLERTPALERLKSQLTQGKVTEMPATDYSISVYASSNTTYALLVDKSRGIIVRERVGARHGEKSPLWAKMQQSIAKAESLAASGNLIVMDSGTPKIIQPNEQTSEVPEVLIP